MFRILQKDPVNIDPTNLTMESAKYLRILLKSRVKKNSTLFTGEYNIFDEGKSQWRKVYITHTLVYREKIHPVTKNKIDCYHVLHNMKHNHGVFGTIYVLLGTLVHFPDDGFYFKNHKKRVIKQQSMFDSTGKAIPCANNEAILSKSAPHLHAKEPTESSDGKYSYLVMKQFNGKDLFKIIDDRPGLESISEDQRLTVSINILRALRDQIHSLNIVHRDIKPANIMVNLDNNEVNIIDLGLSCYKRVANDDSSGDLQKTVFVGSPGYMAPEALLQKNNDQLSDIYSIGIVLCEWWGLVDRQKSYEKIRHSFSADRTPLQYVLNSVLNNIEPALHDFNDLFRTTLSNQHAHAVYRILMNLIAFDPASRLSLTDAINQFELIRLERVLSTVPPMNEQHIIAANQAAIKIREELTRLKSALFMEHHEQLLRLFMSELTGFQHHQKAYDYFKMVLDVHCFKELHSPEEMLDQIKSMSVVFVRHLLLCESLKNKIEIVMQMKAHPRLNESLREILPERLEALLVNTKHLILKHQKRLVNLDEMTYFNHRCDFLISDLFSQFHALIDPLLTANADTLIDHFQAIQAIFARCGLEQGAGDLLRFKNELRVAMRSYLNESLSLPALIGGNRGASSTRMNDVQRLIEIVDAASDAQTLRDNVSAYLAKLETGLLFRSSLRSKIQAVLEAFMPEKSRVADSRWFKF